MGKLKQESIEQAPIHLAAAQEMQDAASCCYVDSMY
jgi:hypothetical protein